MADRQEKNDSHTMPTAILGASGFIGNYLTLTLLHLGYITHLLYNRKDPQFTSVRGKVVTFRGSIENEKALEECFESCETVYHLVGLIAQTKDKTFEKVVEGGTEKVVRAAQNAGVRKIIYLSALGTAPDSDSLYFQTKYRAEQTIINSGLDYTIFRPSIVYGAEDQFINRIASMIKRAPFLPVIGDGLYRLQPVYVEELCAVMASAASEDFTSRKIYEIGGPEQLTYLEIVDIIKRVLEIKRVNIHIPIGLVRLVAALMEKIIKRAPITTDQIKMMRAGSTCDATVAEKAFNVKFSALETQLSKYLRSPHGRSQRI